MLCKNHCPTPDDDDDDKDGNVDNNDDVVVLEPLPNDDAEKVDGDDVIV